MRGMIGGEGVEMRYEKRVDIIFGCGVRYVEVGWGNVIGGKGEGGENVMGVKGRGKDLGSERKMRVIREEGKLYRLKVKYGEEGVVVNVEMCDLMDEGEWVKGGKNGMEMYVREVDKEWGGVVGVIMKWVYENEKGGIGDMGCKGLGMEYVVKGV